ncbi:hypothetical protein GO730_30235 [Spirosoma sp. HMF3257]|uniref:Uncharacterized protein n=1 Tax=Spirosoma telluris TaxID=2183553 RepID=A0A327NTR5_9BACT|nr:hypothetical protein [Spirosoma telluris]RAI77366.1 hypothetical protein HMF3257_30140 [Spirosoma telluris]
MGWTTSQQDALLNAIQRRNERAILQKQLAQTQAELVSRQAEQAILRDQWQQEQADVDQLQRLSWASVFYDLLNQKEERLSKEEAEAQQARLRYDVIATSVEVLQKQRTAQEERLTTYVGVDADYEQLIQEKRVTLSTSSNEVGNQYQHYLDELTRQNHALQELDEAHKAGLLALGEVSHLRKLLDQARSWGRWDMLGGSSMASMAKYRKLDDVRDQSYRVTRTLENFRAEYADIKQTFLSDWQFDSNLTRFVDVFFDNIFTDMAVQSRINTALTTAMALENQLIKAITTLKQQIEQAVEETKQQADAFQRFLEKA